jgi:hypothetical protein
LSIFRDAHLPQTAWNACSGAADGLEHSSSLAARNDIKVGIWQIPREPTIFGHFFCGE